MGKIRGFEKEDLTEVAALRRRTFGRTEHETDAALQEYYERVFFHNPWRDDEIGSQVFEGDDGRIVGFVGVIPRPMVVRGDLVQAAVATELMVSPEARGLAAIQLLSRVYKGPQAFTLSDRANEQTRVLNESLKGAAPLWYSLYWTYPLKPLGHALPIRGWPRWLRGIARAAKPVTGVLDSLSTPALPDGSVEELSSRTVVDNLQKVAGSQSIYPHYDVPSFDWLLDRLAEKPGLGRLEKAQVLQSGEVTGWFIYFVRPGGQAEVVQLAATDKHHAPVFQHLLHHAWKRDAVSLSGRLDRPFVDVLTQHDCLFRLAEPWTVVHSLQPELTQVLQGGRALLSRLDGEWWLSA
jgi:hypothetical protein